MAFQNRNAAAIGGVTLNSGIDLPRPGESRSQTLEYSDIENLRTKLAGIEFVLLEEESMINPEDLGAADAQVTAAAEPTIYAQNGHGEAQFFAGMDLLTFADFWQLPPIPDTEA